MEPLREIIEWQGLGVEVLYNPDWSPVYREVYGYALARLEIRTANREPLLVTETWYLSRFDRADNIAAGGGAIACVRTWLDHAAQSPEWISAQAEARQRSLF
jgi:hypothetical protein